MTTREVATVALVTVLAVLAVVAIVQPELSEHAIHDLHLAAWICGLVDALLVGASFLAGGGH